jgi:hypothetical protein
MTIPADEIEITPEMIEAGFRVLSKSGIADEFLQADKTLVAEIFSAMLERRPQPEVDSLHPKRT